MNMYKHCTLLCDAPQPWGVYFQDSASSQMEALVELHDRVIFFSLIVCIGVFYIIAVAFYTYIKKGYIFYENLINFYDNTKLILSYFKPILYIFWFLSILAILIFFSHDVMLLDSTSPWHSVPNISDEAIKGWIESITRAAENYHRPGPVMFLDICNGPNLPGTRRGILHQGFSSSMLDMYKPKITNLAGYKNSDGTFFKLHLFELLCKPR